MMVKLKLGNVKINLRFSFALLTAATLLLIKSDYAYFSLLAILLHEAGHCLAMLCYGERLDAVEFGFYGIHMRCSRKNTGSPGREALVTLAGPLMNLLAAFLFWGTFLCFSWDPLFYAAGTQLSIGIFNMLPVRGLDGGQLLFSFLERRLLPRTVSNILFAASAVTSAGLIAATYLFTAVPMFSGALTSTFGNTGFSFNYSLIAAIFYLTVNLLNFY